jgi:hypothetical protein
MDICDRQISNLRQQLFKYNTFIIPIIMQDKKIFSSFYLWFLVFSVLLVEESSVPGENKRPAASH